MQDYIEEYKHIDSNGLSRVLDADTYINPRGLRSGLSRMRTNNSNDYFILSGLPRFTTDGIEFPFTYNRNDQVRKIFPMAKKCDEKCIDGCLYCALKRLHFVDYQMHDFGMLGAIEKYSYLIFYCGNRIFYTYMNGSTITSRCRTRPCEPIGEMYDRTFDHMAPKTIFEICVRARSVLWRKKIARHIVRTIMDEIAQNNSGVTLNVAFVTMIMTNY